MGPTGPRLRVLHCPTATAAHGAALAAAERDAGLDSHAVALRANPYEYGGFEILAPEGTSPWKMEWRRWQLLRRALRDFDGVHFNFGRSIAPTPEALRSADGAAAPALVRALYGAYAGALEGIDLPLLRRAGKVIAVTYQGDDARQGDYCREHFEISIASEVDADYYPAGSDARKRRAIARFDRFADRIYALNPDLLHVLPPRARFLPYVHVDPRRQAPAPGEADPAEPLVLHAPTHREAKGTRFVLDAVARLRSEGVRFRFELVEGLSHAEATAQYARADLVVDQLLAGWYGGLAVEVMALAKPVVTYLREGDLRFLPEGMGKELPLIGATPDTIHAVLAEWLGPRRRELRARGLASRRFVERWHDPQRIAARLADDYRTSLAARRAGMGAR